MIYIADVGQNYKNLDGLKELALQVKKANVDFLKPQLFNTDDLYQPTHPYYSWIKSHELSFHDASDIYEYAESINLKCIFSPFDKKRIMWCKEIGIERIKVANRMCTNLEFLDAIKETGIFPIISVSKEKHLPYFSYDDIFGKDKYQLLYTVPKYPSSILDYSLTAITRCGGLSCHAVDEGTLAIASTATRISMIEFHVWYRNYISPDMPVSYHTEELTEIIKKCNAIEKIR